MCVDLFDEIERERASERRGRERRLAVALELEPQTSSLAMAPANGSAPTPRVGLYNVSNTCYLNSVLQVRALEALATRRGSGLVVRAGGDARRRNAIAIARSSAR